MAHNAFQSLLDLVTYDQELAAKLHRIEAHNATIKDLQRQLEDIEGQLHRARTIADHARKEVEAVDQQVKDLDSQEKAKKKHLDTISNQKEYAALKKEIERIKQQQHALESIVVTTWNHYETAQKEYAQNKEALEQQSTQINNQITEINTSIASLNAEYQAAYQERAAKEQAVPEEWREKYQSMHAQVANPIVPVEQESCSGCFYPLSQQDLMEIKRQKLLLCTCCFRFLYSPALMKS